MSKRLIYAEDAIDALKSLEFRQYMDFGEYIGEDIREVCLIRAEKAQDALQSLPSAQPQRIKGRWIRDDFGSFCESCGLYAYLDKFGEVWESNYCPTCGADMRGDEDAAD